MLTVTRYSEKTYEKSGVRPVAKTKENVAENNVFRAQENTRWTSRFSGVHRRKTPNSPDVFQRVENGWQIANFPKIPLLVKLPVNEGFLAVRTIPICSPSPRPSQLVLCQDMPECMVDSPQEDSLPATSTATITSDILHNIMPENASSSDERPVYREL